MDNNDVQNAVAARQLAEHNRLATRANDILAQLEAIPVKQLPEHIFVQTFLPYFCGEKDINAGENLLGLWIGVATTPTSEVEIISSTGIPLFRVPALIDTSIINPVRSDDQAIGFSRIIALANEYSRDIPIVGENILVKNLAIKAKEIQSKSTVFTENEKRWIEIFTRYNKIKKVDKVTTNTPPSPDTLGEDEMIF